MFIKVLVSALVMVCCAPAFADDGYPYRGKFEVSHGKNADLLHESSEAHVQQEVTVQKEEAPSDLFVSIFGGTVSAAQLNVNSNGTTMSYGFNQSLPMLTAQVIHLPWKWHGRLGWYASTGFATGQYDAGDGTKTALYLVPLQAGAVYRYELTSTQKWIPYGMLGPNLWNYVQRGTDPYNFSGSTLGAAASAGIALNLNRIGWINSRFETEITLQYQRQMSWVSSDTNFNGNVIQLGGTIAL